MRLAARMHASIVPDHSEEVLEKLLAALAYSILESLSPMQRAVLTDVSRGLSVTDIAKNRQLTIRSVEGHLRRARAKVRRHLREEPR